MKKLILIFNVLVINSIVCVNGLAMENPINPHVTQDSTEKVTQSVSEYIKDTLSSVDPAIFKFWEIDWPKLFVACNLPEDASLAEKTCYHTGPVVGVLGLIASGFYTARQLFTPNCYCKKQSFFKRALNTTVGIAGILGSLVYLKCLADVKIKYFSGIQNFK